MTPRYGIELPGDWTSATMLLRLMSALEIPWVATERGLVNQETGETCRIEMRRRDARLPSRFRSGECPVRPSLDTEAREGVDEHTSVVTVRAEEGAGPEGGLVVLRAGAAFVDAGAWAVRVLGTGITHGARRWAELAQQASSDDPEMVQRILYLAFVHPIVKEGPRWRTRGMALFEQRDVSVSADVPEAVAFDVMEALNISVLAGTKPPVGAIVRATRRGRPFLIDAGPDPRPEGDPCHNIEGTWILEPSAPPR